MAGGIKIYTDLVKIYTDLAKSHPIYFCEQHEAGKVLAVSAFCSSFLSDLPEQTVVQVLARLDKLCVDGTTLLAFVLLHKAILPVLFLLQLFAERYLYSFALFGPRAL